MSQLLGYSAFLAIIIACLGLYGLASFTAEKRTREIGIRKVLGASTPGIATLLSTEFIKLILIANFISWPVAYYLINNWLGQYAFRAQNSIVIYFISGFAAIIIALLAVSFQSIKAGRAKPMDSLRNE